MRCIIITAGEMGCLTRDDLKLKGDELIICCDAGYNFALAQRIRPHLVIGDFDSLGSFPAQGDFEVERLRAEKDETDTLMAVKRAIERGATEIELVAATGRRLDHTFANIQVLKYIAERGISAKIVGAHEDIWVFRNSSITLTEDAGRTFSVFTLSDRSRGVSITGAKYPLDNVVLESGFPLGVSNVVGEGGQAKISVTDGTLMAMVTFNEQKDDSRGR